MIDLASTPLPPSTQTKNLLNFKGTPATTEVDQRAKKFLQVCLIPLHRAPINVAETDPTKLNSKNASSQNKQ